MAVNLANVNTKLAALAAKDLPSLVASQIDIPFLGRPYTLAQLQAWLKKRTDQLNNAKTATDAQLLAAKNTAYSQLDTGSQAVADKILAGQSYTLPANLTSANYDRLVAIILYTFITAP